jgi:glyoxylase-like metal-dependent hydrolase (beta-lactamase superfamily II)
MAEKLWRGDASTAEVHPMKTFLGLEEYAPGLAFVSGFANVVLIRTGAGLVMVDTGNAFAADVLKTQVRAWSDAPVHTAVYTHGHIDHVMGVPAFEKDQSDPVNVVAHEAVAARFDRYKLTAGYNAAINARQFRAPGLRWPVEYRYPDRTFRDTLTLDVGGERIELIHARGETDDHCFVWVPERGALCTGDLFIWASPNCGNPQKVQRFPREWGVALHRMAELGAEMLFPGHGPPIEGAARVRTALEETAELLETLHDRTVALMNERVRGAQHLAPLRRLVRRQPRAPQAAARRRARRGGRLALGRGRSSGRARARSVGSGRSRARVSARRVGSAGGTS